MLSDVSENILKEVNRNDAPSDVDLQKISSEGVPNDDLDSDFHIFLFKLKEKFIFPSSFCILRMKSIKDSMYMVLYRRI